MPVPDQRRDFVDRCLSASDNAMAHASALARLADRYDPSIATVLSSTPQAGLHEMLRIYLDRLMAADAELDPVIELLPGPLAGRKTVDSRTWQDGIKEISTAVREQDSMITALVTGSQNPKLDLGAASGRISIRSGGTDFRLDCRSIEGRDLWRRNRFAQRTNRRTPNGSIERVRELRLFRVETWPLPPDSACPWI